MYFYLPTHYTTYLHNKKQAKLVWHTLYAPLYVYVKNNMKVGCSVGMMQCNVTQITDDDHNTPWIY